MVGKTRIRPGFLIACYLFISVSLLSGCAVSDYTNHNVTKDFGPNYYITQNVTKIVYNVINGSTAPSGNVSVGNCSDCVTYPALYARVFNETEINAKLANRSNWNTAYSWGDHATEGYLHSSDLNPYVSYPALYARVLNETESNNLFPTKAMLQGNLSGLSLSLDNDSNLTLNSLKIFDNANTPASINVSIYGDARDTLMFSGSRRDVGSSSFFQKNVEILSRYDGEGNSLGEIKVYYGGIAYTNITSDIQTQNIYAEYISSNGEGTSIEWATAYGWGNHASQGYLKAANLTSYPTKAMLQGNVTVKNPENLDNTSVLYYVDDYAFWSTARLQMVGGALSSGTSATYTTLFPYRRGMVYIRDSTTANGGYLFRTDATIMYFQGGERYEISICLPNTANRANTTFIMGFSDATTAAEPTDGCYFRAVNRQLQGRCKNNAGPTLTASNFTMIQNRCYRLTINLNSAASSAAFAVYNITNMALPGVSVWTGSVAGNIPTTTSRGFGWSWGGWQSTTDAAADLYFTDRLLVRANN
jgi:hypothetical protein